MSNFTEELHKTAGRLSITNDDDVAKMLHSAAERIAERDAEIAQLRGELEAAEQHVKILSEQLATLQSDADTEAESVAALREQVARMPVRVGYVCIEDFREFSRARVWAQTITANRTVHNQTPIYIDPPPAVLTHSRMN